MKTTFLKVVLLGLATTASMAVSQNPAVTHNTWTSGTSIPTPVKFPAGTGVIKGKIYVVGGDNGSVAIADTQIYDTATNTWTSGAAMPVATLDGGGAVVKNILYIFGGTPDGGATVSNAVWAYNPKTKAWTSKAAMPTARDSAVAVVEKNIIYVIGGNGSNGNYRLNTVESYNPSTDTWAEEAPLLVGKSEPSGGLIGSTIVVADGFTLSGLTGDNEEYNAASNSWTARTPDPVPRNGACGGPVGGQLYVAGGNNGGNVTESFKLLKNKWTNLASMPKAVIVPGSAAYRGLLYCIGGGDNGVPFQGNVFNYMQIYQP
jgi:N-acetylneuraminic acid mutarotase